MDHHPQQERFFWLLGYFASTCLVFLGIEKNTSNTLTTYYFKLYRVNLLIAQSINFDSKRFTCVSELYQRRSLDLFVSDESDTNSSF